ncbi:MAG: arginine--tRNA ligase, partial [Candidatus Methylomirabilales bacterium]
MRDRLADLKSDLAERLHEAARGALGVEIPGEVIWETPDPRFGDLATPVAFGLAKVARQSPRRIAETLVAHLAVPPQAVDRVEVAGGGYLNLHLTPAFWHDVIPVIMEEQEQYGRATLGKGERILVEFVSANPTGPLHVGHGRGAAVGDAIANLLAAVGFAVEREFYINDVGTQIEQLARSVLARYREQAGRPASFPAEGYHGEYVRDLATRLHDACGDKFLDGDETEALPLVGEAAGGWMLEELRCDLEQFGVRFDTWFSERSLFLPEVPPRTLLARLWEEGRASPELLEEREGALWLRTTVFGDDKDRVLIRSNGTPTYFLSDVLYHASKIRRGYGRLINVWGADHHGYIPRVRGAIQTLGYDPGALHIVLVQMVAVLRGGQPVPMSKRTGQFITLAEVLQEVGRDAARFLFLTRRPDSHLDFDLEVAKSQSMENPVYYVQYAHVRLASVLREAAKAGREDKPEGAPLHWLTTPEELALLKHLTRYPEVVAGAALHYEPHRIPAFLQGLASDFHSYYNKHRILTEEGELTWARLALVRAMQWVLANALHLLGVDAP